MMIAITGHLEKSQRLRSSRHDGGTYLQKDAFMQLSQLEKAVLTSVTLSLASVRMSRLAMSWATLRATASLTSSHALGRRDLTMATSTEGILKAFGPSTQRQRIQTKKKQEKETKNCLTQ